jgi:nucleotide-binding universal stress UspA family protein
VSKHASRATGQIVVGIDGSEPSVAALRWAADEARRRECTLRAVACWSYPVMPFAPYQLPISGEQFEADARVAAAAEIEQELGADHGGVDVEVEVIEGPASLRLLELDGEASMIVVGSRGRGGFTGLLLGSVSQHLAEHAHCPVVIVPGNRGEE